MYLKAALLLLILLFSSGLLLSNMPTWRTGVLLVLVVWASARLYYFMFYVIERYIDSSYRFSGVVSALAYLLGRSERERRTPPGGTVEQGIVGRVKDERSRMLRGSCLCGGIRYEVTGDLELTLNCHCSMCRKATGAAFRSRARVPAAAFRWVAGEQLLSRYESSPGQVRTFCSVCGSTLVTIFPNAPEALGLAMGTLDDDPGVKPSFHVHVASKAPWHEITDSLPQFETTPDAR
jgi:hypothetical protein